MEYPGPGGGVEKGGFIVGEEQVVPAFVVYGVNYAY